MPNATTPSPRPRAPYAVYRGSQLLCLAPTPAHLHDFLRDYEALTGSLVAYAVSTVVCWAMSVRHRDDFDFASIRRRTGDFTDDAEPLAEDALTGARGAH